MSKIVRASWQAEQQLKAQLRCLVHQSGAKYSQHLQVNCWCMNMSQRRTCWGMMQHAPNTVSLQLTSVTGHAGRSL